jgi:hypothetical protein
LKNYLNRFLFFNIYTPLISKLKPSGVSFVLLLFFSFFFLNADLYPQSNCNSATQVYADGSASPLTSNDYEYWLMFNDADEAASLMLIFAYSQFTTIDDIQLYSGDCNNLVLIQSDIAQEDTVVLFYNNLIPNAEYYIRILRNNDYTINFDVSLYSSISSIDCESATICSINYNGEFGEDKMSNDLIDAIINQSNSLLYTDPLIFEGYMQNIHICGWFKYEKQGVSYHNNTPQIKAEYLSGVYNYYLYLQSYNFSNPYFWDQQEHAKTPFEMEQGTKYLIKFRYRTFTDYPVTGIELSVQNYPTITSTPVGTFTIPTNYIMDQWAEGEFVFTAPITANRLIFAPEISLTYDEPAIINLDDIEIVCITTASSGDYVNFHNASASDVINYYNTNIVTTTDYINITGNFSVDVHLSFAICPNLYFGSATTLIVDNGVRFEITENSHVRASCSCMWNSINANGSDSEVSISGSTIEDGKIVVNTLESKNISLTQSTFSNNYQVLRIFKPNASSQQDNGIVQGNMINGSSSLPYYPFQGVKSHTAIRLNYVNNLTIGGLGLYDGNYISNWYAGVHSTNSLVNYYKNTFDNINMGDPCYVTPPVNPYTIYCPTAIFSTANTAPTAFDHKITVGGAGLENTFINCYDGIYSLEQQALIRNNVFNEVKTAIVCRDFLTNTFLNNNTFIDVESGITAFLTTPLIRYFEARLNTMTDVTKSGIYINSFNSSGRITVFVDEKHNDFPISPIHHRNLWHTR